MGGMIARYLAALLGLAAATWLLPGITMADGTLTEQAITLALVAVIFREGKVIVPFGQDHIEEGDSVVVVVKERGISELSQVFAPRGGRA